MKCLITFVLLIFLCGNVSAQVCQTNYVELRKIVVGMGWVVTSEMGGGHNAHSKHYRGKAIDVRTRGRTEFHVQVLMEIMKNAGYYVLDERKRPKGQRVWRGEHLHISVPNCQ